MLGRLSAYSERLNYLANLRCASRYLEIGVNRGDTFFKVPLPLKVAVDPDFKFNPAELGRPGEFFFSTTSDDFFHQLGTPGSEVEQSLSSNFPEGKIAFDLIFLDGLHTFEQTLRDFANSLHFSHENTIWLLDDTVPSDEYSALPDMDRSLAARRKAGIKGMTWHGDVFKVIPAIHDHFPDYSYCTLIEDNPQTVVWKAAKRDVEPVFASLEAIAAMSCHDIARHIKLFMLTKAKELPGLLGRTVVPEAADQPEARSRFKRIFYADSKPKLIGRLLCKKLSFIPRLGRSIRKRLS